MHKSNEPGQHHGETTCTCTCHSLYFGKRWVCLWPILNLHGSTLTTSSCLLIGCNCFHFNSLALPLPLRAIATGARLWITHLREQNVSFNLSQNTHLHFNPQIFALPHSLPPNSSYCTFVLLSLSSWNLLDPS